MRGISLNTVCFTVWIYRLVNVAASEGMPQRVRGRPCAFVGSVVGLFLHGELAGAAIEQMLNGNRCKLPVLGCVVLLLPCFVPFGPWLCMPHMV